MKKFSDAVVYVLLFILGCAIMAALFAWYFIPKRDKQLAADAQAKAGEIKTGLENTNSQIDKDTEAQVAVVRQRASDILKQNPVDVANAMIAKLRGKGK